MTTNAAIENQNRAALGTLGRLWSPSSRLGCIIVGGDYSDRATDAGTALPFSRGVAVFGVYCGVRRRCGVGPQPDEPSAHWSAPRPPRSDSLPATMVLTVSRYSARGGQLTSLGTNPLAAPANAPG